VCRGNRYLHRSGNLTDGRRRRIPLVVALDLILDAEHKLLALASHIVLISYPEQQFLIDLLYTKRAEIQGGKILFYVPAAIIGCTQANAVLRKSCFCSKANRIVVMLISATMHLYISGNTVSKHTIRSNNILHKLAFKNT
jgi:hypothetical protein